MKKLRFMIVSEVLPSPTTAGALLLHRHFSELEDVSISCASYSAATGTELGDKYFQLDANLPRWIDRLKKTRLKRFVNAFDPARDSEELRRELADNKYDAIITVAQGHEWMVAQRLAKQTGLPLITFFHDWWAAIGGGGPLATAIFERKYRQLAADSKVVFSISEEMHDYLGKPKNSVVLYPIPGQNQRRISSDAALPPRKLAYAGALYSSYGDLIVEAAEALNANPLFDFTFAGKFLPGNETLARRAEASGRHAGFLKGEAFDQFIGNATALLVLGAFTGYLRKFCETNFPSKLTEYATYGRPLVIWAPEYSSSVRWARKHSSALVVTNPDPAALVSAVHRLFEDPAEQRRLCEKSREAARTMFARQGLQEIFEKNLRQAVSQTGQPRRESLEVSAAV